jgi:Zn-dependent protease
MEYQEKGTLDYEKLHSDAVRLSGMRRIRTSNTEITHILIAWVAISYAFAILLLWFNFGRRPMTEELFSGIASPLAISLSTVGVSFLVHELSHKVVAQRYGSWAEFRMNPMMLFIMLFLVYNYGILFAAPGAVMIYGGMIGRRENGRISVAGPLSNILLAFMFLPLLSEGGIIYEIGRYGVLINIALALFNMLPFGIFDGRKVWAWNKLVYLLVVITGIFLVMLYIGMTTAPVNPAPF